MLTIYTAAPNKLIKIDDAPSDQQLRDAMWIDLHTPTEQEEKRVEALLGIDVPTLAEMGELELSNRLYKENGVFYFTLTLITHSESEEPVNRPYTFVVTPKQLITARYADTQAFRVFSDRLQKNVTAGDITPVRVTMTLWEAIVNRLADILEASGTRVEGISKEILRGNPAKQKSQTTMMDTIRDIGTEGELLSKTKESLVSLNRLIIYARQADFVTPNCEEDHRLTTLAHDVLALNDHASFLANKISFLLDATLGVINIQQNGIIKIFSVAAVIFLPPTLVASIYGMNFKHMPELEFIYGYPMAITLIVLAAYLPYRFFKYKNWL